MQFFTRKTILITLIVIALGALAFLAYQADQPSTVAPADDWEQVTQRPGAKHESILINVQGAQLEAELFLPEGGDDRKPAVVFITGSGDSLYQNYADGLIEAFVLDVFLPRDMAVLLVNKRGMGQSSGSWLNNDFQGRADDIYSAVQYLQIREEIDPQNMGVMGHSQGGWIANLVAAQHEDLAFFISLAGPTTSVAAQMQDTYRNVFACDGSEGEDLNRRTANQLRITQLGATIGRVLPLGVIGFDAGIIGYDPEEALRNVRQPGLFAFGEYDPFVPPGSSFERLRVIFGDDVPANLTFVTISQANHRFKVVSSLCASPEEMHAAEFSSELTTELDRWLVQNGY
ncbi:MAG: alpha/beta fold hydrolase [Anaerolineales bacterium]|jgi:pimeloyl-ACP methyl ester carboxylesterase